MIRLNIESYDCNGQKYEHAEKFVADRTSLYTELEEALYILYEIEPRDRNWRDEIHSDGAMFTYAKVDACVVNLYKQGNEWYTVEVKDI